MRFPAGVVACFVALTVVCSLANAAGTRRLTSPDLVARARKAVKTEPWARKERDELIQSVQWLIDMPDEDLWDFVPAPEMPRALHVRTGFDCPIHGKEVYSVGGFYPWITRRERPFKVECPVGHEVYPTNDYASFLAARKSGSAPVLDTKQPYVDDGMGWISPQGDRYWFVAYYTFWQRWQRDLLPSPGALAKAYLLTDDKRYAHKAAILLSRIAADYPRMNFALQTYHAGRYPSLVPGKILDHIWETKTCEDLATAYQQIAPALDGDRELRAFLARKGIPNLSRNIEKNLFEEMVAAIYAGTIRGNPGRSQTALAVLARVMEERPADSKFSQRAMIDWIVKGPGGVERLLANNFFRDGCGTESVAYSAEQVSILYRLASNLKPLGVDFFQRPKFRKLADCLLDVPVLAGRFTPLIGDSGDMRGSNPFWDGEVFRLASAHFRDARYQHAAELLNRKPSLWSEPVTSAAGKSKGLGSPANPSRLLGGYGLAILESGSGTDARALALYYGSSTGAHGHFDKLNIELWAKGTYMLPELSYPAQWDDKGDRWTRGTISHYSVLVDGRPHNSKLAGELKTFAAVPGVQLVDASASQAYGNIAGSNYRRTVAMIDVSPRDSYVVDVFRVRGGTRHEYSFHGPAFDQLEVAGATFGAREAGTVAGPSVAFGASPPENPDTGYQYLRSPRRARPSAPWAATWRGPADAGLRWLVPGPGSEEVVWAEGEPELRPGAPKQMPYFLRRRTGRAPLESTFLSVIEPFQKENAVSMLLPLSGSGSGFAGCVVGMKGQTDLILSTPDPNGHATVHSGLEITGEFGVIRVSAGTTQPERLTLLAGSLLSYGGWRIEATSGFKFRVVGLDVAANSMTVTPAVDPSLVVGRVVTIGNELHQTGYTILAASSRGDKTVLSFGDVSPLTLTGRVQSVDDKRLALSSATSVSKIDVVYGGALQGFWVTNAARSAAFQIASVRGDEITVRQGSRRPSEVFRPNEEFFVYDVGVGDLVALPGIVDVRSTGTGRFDVMATGKASFQVPTGDPSAECWTRVGGGRWQRATSSRDTASLSCGIGTERTTTQTELHVGATP